MTFLLPVFAIVFFLPLAEAFIYPGFIQNFFRISVLPVVASAALLACLLKYFSPHDTFLQVGVWLIYRLVPLITILSLMLRAIELLTYPNFIFTTLHIAPTEFALFGVYSFFMAVPFLTLQYIKEHWRSSFLAISLLLYHLLNLFWINSELFFLLNKEDSLVEYATFICFVAGGLLSIFSLKFIAGYNFTLHQRRIVQILLASIGISLLIIAAEEISWGQRIFNLKTPESIALNNIQEEITIHNNIYLFRYVYAAYAVINIYGLLSWKLFAHYSKKLSTFHRTFLRIITTRWYLMALFVPNLIYCLLRFEYGNEIIDQWEEYTELYLAIGILMTTFRNFQFIRNRR